MAYDIVAEIQKLARCLRYRNRQTVDAGRGLLGGRIRSRSDAPDVFVQLVNRGVGVVRLKINLNVNSVSGHAAFCSLRSRSVSAPR